MALQVRSEKGGLPVFIDDKTTDLDCGSCPLLDRCTKNSVEKDAETIQERVRETIRSSTAFLIENCLRKARKKTGGSSRSNVSF